MALYRMCRKLLQALKKDYVKRAGYCEFGEGLKISLTKVQVRQGCTVSYCFIIVFINGEVEKTVADRKG